MTDFPGIPGCKIISVLGEGGMANVYLGIQEKLNRKVAVKVLKTSGLKDKTIAARFDQEAKTAASLSHSNIVQIYDTGQSGENHYIVMEYLAESLKDRLKQSPQGKMYPEMALDIIQVIIRALDYAHFRGVYHRDIKQDNIMFREDNTPVVLDFGIARLLDSTDDLTKSGQSLGTVYYMSPEQCRGEKGVDGRSDIYSLGVVLYQMLTGKRPYEGEIQVAIALQHVQEPIPRLPQDLNLYQPLIDKMMAKDRMERLSSAAEFLRLLDKVLKSSLNITPSPIEASPDQTTVFPSHLEIIKQPPSKLQESSPSPIPPKPTQKEFIYKKPTKREEPLLNKYFNLADEKIRTFFKVKMSTSVDKREKLDSNKKPVPFMNAIKKKCDSFNNYPLKKKLVLGILPVIILVVISLIIFGPGSESILKPPVSSTSVDQFLTQKSLYYIDLNLVLDLYKKRDIESLEKALIVINNLKQVEPIPELNQWGKNINNRIEELENEFEIYLTIALNYFNKKNLSKARENLLKAKQIKTTERLKELEDIIEQKLLEKSKKKKGYIILTDD